ncbi:hypothetical protein EC957_012451 [Mortierella hygrophila]|uniref:F-box domain-containing protein n=1 Tax=Mortierella hygrophila TaxID=979708 RepID=A0A9P6F867_9FUNG|nr:hypothetical protein EC957_012451 [Mortierella hygrophila]
MFVFDIPEIRDHLAQYLNPRQLGSAMLVCQDWHSTFLPFLYRSTSVIATSEKNPTPATIEKYAHLIQTLRISGFTESLEYYAVPCRNLHTLTLDGNWTMSYNGGMFRRVFGSMSSSSSSDRSMDGAPSRETIAAEFSSTVADLIHRNPGLVHILLIDQPCISSTKFWNALAESPKLSSMHLTSCTIHPNDTPAFWEACSNTETLYLLRLKLPDGEAFYPPLKNHPLPDQKLLLPVTDSSLSLPPPPSPPSAITTLMESSLSLNESSIPPKDTNSNSATNNKGKGKDKALFSRLQVLYMNGISDGFRIISQAPLLRSWQWTLGTEPFPREDIELTFPHLKPFSFFRDLKIQMLELDDTHIEDLLDRMTDARDVNLNWTGFGPKSFQVLMIRHTMTLRSLSLLCVQIQSKQIQTLLTSCPGLESFVADVLFGTELVRYGAPTKEGSEDSNEVDFTSPDYEYDMSVSAFMGSGMGTLLGDDWVCLGLKSLTLNFALWGKNIHLKDTNLDSQAAMQKQYDLEQEHTFRQLARLTQLEKLELINATGKPPFVQGVNLNLRTKGGRLEDLAPLTRLDMINFSGTQQLLDEEELEWMWDHWPRLFFIMGVFNKDPVVNKRVVAAYKERQKDKLESTQ